MPSAVTYLPMYLSASCSFSSAVKPPAIVSPVLDIVGRLRSKALSSLTYDLISALLSAIPEPR